MNSSFVFNPLLLLPLVSLAPLGGAFVNQTLSLVLSGFVWAVYLGILMVTRDNGINFQVLSQLPMVALLSLIAWIYSRKVVNISRGQENTSATLPIEELKRKHALLKEDVTKIEKEETQSLQIYAAAKSLAEALSWKDMAPRLTLGIQKIFGAQEFLLYVLNDEGGWDLLHRRGGWTQEPPIQGPIHEDVLLLHPPLTTEVVPVLSVPVYVVGAQGLHLNGALFLKAPVRERTEADLVAAGKQFAEQLGMTLNKARLFAQMETHSRVDGLTGTLRRQAFMDRLHEELKRAKVFQTPFSLMMVDIDHFKAVNDSHGHAAGDAVLKRVGEMLKESVYETDVVGRYGGEEFIILLPKADPQGVFRKAEALRQRMERDVIAFGFERLKITVSVGLSHYPKCGTVGEALIESADKALYRAKESGRNRVIEGG